MRWLDGHEFEQTLGNGEGQGSLGSSSTTWEEFLGFCKSFSFSPDPKMSTVKRTFSWSLPAFQPVSTDFAQYSSSGDVSGGVRGEAQGVGRNSLALLCAEHWK